MPKESQGSSPGSIDIVLKIAERCNLACDYCYYYFQEYDGNKNKPFITDEVIKELPCFLLRSAEQLNLRALNIAFHGGEPLLLKKAVFDHLCTSIREVLDNKVDLRFAMQTNGVLIDEEWVNLFSKHEVLVGVSIDGSRELHDRHRRDHRGRGSYDKAVRGLKLLQEAVAQHRLRSAGVMGVIAAGDEGEGEQNLRHLVEQLGAAHPALNVPRGGWDNADAFKWNRAVESHRRTIKYWLSELVYPKFHYVKEFADVLDALRTDEGADRKDRWASQRHYVATISSEGVIRVDDNVLAVDESFAQSKLTIFGTSLRDFFEDPIWRRLNEAVDDVPKECGECEWFRSCRSGHLFNRFSKKDGFTRPSVLCDTIKAMHEEVANYLLKNGLVTIRELAGRLSTPSTCSATDALRAVTTRTQSVNEVQFSSRLQTRGNNVNVHNL